MASSDSSRSYVLTDVNVNKITKLLTNITSLGSIENMNIRDSDITYKNTIKIKANILIIEKYIEKKHHNGIVDILSNITDLISQN